MEKRTGTIKNAYGIHCRPSSVISKIVKDYPGTIEIIGPAGVKANPKSVLAMLSLALTKGSEFTVTVEGENEKEMCERMIQLLESEYDFQKD